MLIENINDYKLSHPSQVLIYIIFYVSYYDYCLVIDYIIFLSVKLIIMYDPILYIFKHDLLV